MRQQLLVDRLPRRIAAAVSANLAAPYFAGSTSAGLPGSSTPAQEATSFPIVAGVPSSGIGTPTAPQAVKA